MVGHGGGPAQRVTASRPTDRELPQRRRRSDRGRRRREADERPEDPAATAGVPGCAGQHECERSEDEHQEAVHTERVAITGVAAHRAGRDRGLGRAVRGMGAVTEVVRHGGSRIRRRSEGRVHEQHRGDEGQHERAPRRDPAERAAWTDDGVHGKAARIPRGGIPFADTGPSKTPRRTLTGHFGTPGGLRTRRT